jgi:hypothetical protein
LLCGEDIMNKLALIFASTSALFAACAANDGATGPSQTAGGGGKADGDCGDGSVATCEIVPPTCEPGTVLKVEDGCFAGCVDPDTCEAPPEEGTEKTTRDLLNAMIDLYVDGQNLDPECNFTISIDSNANGYAHLTLEQGTTSKTIHLGDPNNTLTVLSSDSVFPHKTTYKMSTRSIDVLTWEDSSMFAIAFRDSDGALRCDWSE